MTKILSIVALSVFALAGCASASDTKVASRTYYVGGQDPGRSVRDVAVPEPAAPYALTGDTAAKRYEPIRVGNQVAGYREAQK